MYHGIPIDCLTENIELKRVNRNDLNSPKKLGHLFKKKKLQNSII